MVVSRCLMSLQTPPTINDCPGDEAPPTPDNTDPVVVTIHGMPPAITNMYNVMVSHGEWIMHCNNSSTIHVLHNT